MLAIIGGTGFDGIQGFKESGFKRILTPFSKDRVIIELYSKNSATVAVVLRHGKKHHVPPHKINYRANIWALHAIGVQSIIAINAIGGINPKAEPGAFIIPDQIIDYSHGRDATFYEENLDQVTHIDFTDPFTEELRQIVKDAFHAANKNSNEKRILLDNGVYGCTQGPRLETAAEINRLRQDGCDIVGMTVMPEAALARELKLDYASLALCVNWAAGVTDEKLVMDTINLIAKEGMDFLSDIITEVIKRKFQN